jgi:hypothetical protein
MSARESSDHRHTVTYGGAAYTRWPGLLSLSLGWLLPPFIALVNQQLIYAANMWACGRNMHASMHLVPLLCVIVTVATGFFAYRDWRQVGAGVEEEGGDVLSRSRFIAIGGMVISVFSSLVILAQWAAIVVLDPCMRA